MTEIYDVYKTANLTQPGWNDLRLAADASLGATTAKAAYFRDTGRAFGVTSDDITP
jgi:hypothetical protein